MITEIKPKERERLCRICGKPAMPVEEKYGLLCLEHAKATWDQYNARRRAKKNAGKTIRYCELCGGRINITNHRGICTYCRESKAPRTEDDRSDKELYEYAREWNKQHPIKASVVRNLVIAMQRIRGNCQPDGRCR